jgi:hypothetical protein
LAAGVVLTLIASLVGVAGLVLSQGDAEDSVAAWPAEIRPFVEFVEDERGLQFKHPVPVDFLPPEEFRKEVTTDESTLTAHDRQEIRETEGLFRALGLLDRKTDLFKATNDLSGAGTIGYYSNEDKLIRVRGDGLTPAAKVTLVHELTHALQDQYFDLSARMKELQESDDSSAASAYRALVEGDAVRIENAYRSSLTDDERAAVEDEEAVSNSDYSKEVADIPQILQTLMASPYALGQAMLAVATAVDGNDAVDALFRNPPTTDEQLLDPWTVVHGRDEAVDVGEVKVADDEKEFDSGSFGALTWYLMLSERVPLVESLDAVDGWAGDAYVGFKRDGTTCVRVRYRGETSRDGTEMETALDDWTSAAPVSGASVKVIGSDLLFESCDRGAAAHVGTDSSGRALGLVLTRTYLSISVFQGSGDEQGARCVADKAVHEFTPRQISDPRFAVDNPEVRQRIGAIALSCLGAT